MSAQLLADLWRLKQQYVNTQGGNVPSEVKGNEAAEWASLAKRARLVVSADKWGLSTEDLDKLEAEILSGEPFRWTLHFLRSAGVEMPCAT